MKKSPTQAHIAILQVLITDTTNNDYGLIKTKLHGYYTELLQGERVEIRLLASI